MHPQLKILKKENAENVEVLEPFAYKWYNSSLCQRMPTCFMPSHPDPGMIKDHLLIYLYSILLFLTYTRQTLFISENCWSSSMPQTFLKSFLEKMCDECFVFTIQIDGSVSKQMEDNKCISWRIAAPNGNMSAFFHHNKKE